MRLEGTDDEKFPGRSAVSDESDSALISSSLGAVVVGSRVAMVGLKWSLVPRRERMRQKKLASLGCSLFCRFRQIFVHVIFSYAIARKDWVSQLRGVFQAAPKMNGRKEFVRVGEELECINKRGLNGEI